MRASRKRPECWRRPSTTKKGRLPAGGSEPNGAGGRFRPAQKRCIQPSMLGDYVGMGDFKKLRVWQKALALSLAIDRLTKRIRARQYTSFKSQIFRAGLSIPANIAEGRRKKTEKEFARFLTIAAGSSSELESHLIFAREAGIIEEAELASLVGQTIEVRKMLYALIRRLSG